MSPRWIRDDEALALLDSTGEPFAHAAYRRAWTEAAFRWHDASFGARMSDGTRAAIPLLVRRRLAESLPLGYGGVVASRALAADETSSFLHAARQAARSDVLQAWTAAIEPAPEQLHVGGVVVAWTGVVHLRADAPADAQLSTKGRQAIARAAHAGGVARAPSCDPEPFLELYTHASQAWSARYPAEVLRRLAREGVLRTYDTELDGATEASAVALVGERHWMYWLAAQSEAGRSAELGYIALAALVADAHASGARAVNLGASVGLPGVAAFKRRFGAVGVPVIEYRSQRTGAVPARSAAAGVQRRWRSLRQARTKSRTAPGADSHASSEHDPLQDYPRRLPRARAPEEEGRQLAQLNLEEARHERQPVDDG